MKPLQAIQDRIIRRGYRKVSRYLRTLDPARLEAQAHKRVLAAFHRAAASSRGYGDLLAEAGVKPAQIRTIQDFRNKVPLLSKEKVFSQPLGELIAERDLRGIDQFWTSSGRTGTFSFGAGSSRDQKSIALGLEFLLHEVFGVLDHRTLLINCNAMGVQVPTRTVSTATTGLRSDAVLKLTAKLTDCFEQILINGEHPFLKEIVEQGCRGGLDWKAAGVSFITGGEFVPETWRSYIMQATGIEPDDPTGRKVVLNMGLSELSLSIFSDDADLIRIRRAVHDKPDLQEALFGRNDRPCPEILHYYPTRTYLETVENEAGSRELVVSLLDKRQAIPLLRYHTGDAVDLLDYTELVRRLTRAGLEDLIPTRRLPVGIIWGSDRRIELPNGLSLAPEMVKEILYARSDIAECLTANFRIGRPEGSSWPSVKLQLKQDARLPSDAPQVLSASLQEYTRDPIALDFIAYRDFPWAMELSYERKFRYA